MPETSNLRLTPDQERELVTYCLARIKQLERDNKDRIEADRKSWKDYHNSKAYRAQEEGVFQHENLSLPMTSMIVDSFSSRSEEEIVGSSPFFHAKPKGNFPSDTALSLNRALHFRLNDESDLREKLELSFTPAYVQSALILKSVYREEWDTFEDFDTPVLFDNVAQEYVTIVDDTRSEEVEIRYVEYGSEKWIPDLEPNPETNKIDKPIYRLEVSPDLFLTEEEYKAEPGDAILLGSRYSWQMPQDALVRKELLCKGARTVLVEYDHFFAQSNISTLDDGNFMFEIYDRDASWIERRWLKANGRPSWNDVKNEFTQDNASPKTEGEREKSSKEVLEFDQQVSVKPIYECWVVRDVMGKGYPQRFCIQIEKTSERAVYYEYAAKMLPSPRMRHPFTAASPTKTKDRWYGDSLVKMLEPFQDFIDINWNRWAYRNSIATNPIIKYDPSKTREGKNFHDLKPFEIITPEQEAALSEILEAFVFPQAENNTKDLIDRILFMVQLWLGVSNLSQGDYSDIPENTTAYGMDATLRESGKISRRWSRRLVRGIAAHIKKLARIELDTMDDSVAFRFSDGDEETVEWLRKEAVEGVDFDIEIVVSKQHTQATVEANRLVEEIADKYAMRDPISRQRIRPIYRSSLMALGHDDADKLLPKPTEEEIAAYIADLSAPGGEGDENAAGTDPEEKPQTEVNES